MMGRILARWRIISGTGIYNQQRGILRLRRIDLRSSGGISVWGENPWRFGGLPELQGPSGLALPQELPQRYSKCSPLTVLLRPQVQNYSLTKLRLILAGAMASAIQQFLGSNQRVKATSRPNDTVAFTLTTGRMSRRACG